MPIDASIALGVKPIQIDSPLNALGQVAQLQNAQNQNALSQYTLSKARRTDDETNALAALRRTPGFDISTPEGQSAAYGAAPLSADSYIKANLANRKTVSDISASDAKVRSQAVDDAHKKIDMVGQVFGYVRQNPTVDAANQALDVLQQSGAFKPEQIAQWRANAQANPASIKPFADQAFQSALDAKSQLPTFQTRNTGGATDTLAIDPVSGKVAVASSVKNTQSPDSIATNATSRATNAATIAKDYAVAGINPDGSSSGANDSMVDAIGQYKVAPPSGMALRNPRMQQILAEVTQKYPDFDATQYGARQVAAKSFSTGKDGQSVQSANTALNHLATLKELAAAQDNGDIRLFNTIANRFATETGGSAPTNLAAAVTMVGPEISKAVIGSGAGGQGDRDKVDSALASLTKGGKGQAAGTIATMQDLFGGRLTEAQRTYQRTTGRNDFPATFLSPAAQAVLAARTGAQPGAAVPPDIAAILKKHGGK